MARVFFSAQLQQYTDRLSELSVQADNYRDLVQILTMRFPGIEEPLAETMVAIDGDIIHDPFLEKITADSELHFLPKIGAG